MNEPFNRVIRFEMHASKIERAVNFYKDVFGWDIKKWEGRGLDYRLVETCPEGTPDGINGGIVQDKLLSFLDNNFSVGCVLIINVEDIDATTKKIVSSGGSIIMPKFNLKGKGDIAYFKDTEGIAFAILQE